MLLYCVVESDDIIWEMDLVTQVVYGAFTEGSNFKVMARIVGLDNAVLASGTIGTCTLTVYDLNAEDPTASIYSNTISNPIAALSTSGWSVDSIGYNFSHSVDSTTVFNGVDEGGHRYRLEYVMPAASGSNGTAKLIAEMTCLPGSMI